MDVLNLIHQKLPSLSKGQKRIAQYIIDEFDKAAFLTAGALGKAVQVSESTVVRFASELGFDGYPELQKALQEMVLSRLTGVQRLEAAQSRIKKETLLVQTLHDDAQRIRETENALDQSAFNGAVDAMLRARRIYVLGVRSSSALAGFLEYYLRYIFEDVRLITSASSAVVLEELLRLSPSDVLIAVSFPRYSAAVSQAMEYAKHNGAKTVALTDSTSSPLAANADYLLTAKCDMLSLVNSLVAPMSVINALIVSAASRRKQETTASFDQLEDVWDAYHVYEKYDS